MTHPRFLFTLAVSFLLTATSSAADYPVKITATRVGLPPGGKATDRDESGAAAHLAKFACWAPVYVDLDLAGSVTEQAELVVEAADPDEIATTLAVPLNLAGVAPGKLAAVDLGCIGYVRPAGVGEVTVSIRTKDGKPLSEPFRVRSLRPRDPLTYVVLSLGAAFPGFDLPRPPGAPEQTTELRGGRVELTAISSVAQLPDRWVGYEAADLVILNTSQGSDEFLRKLFGEASGAAEKAKRAALLEWMRRGGRLVVTVGGNAALVSQLPALKELLPFEVKGTRAPGIVQLSWASRDTSQTSTSTKYLGQKGNTFPLANLLPKADHPARVLIPLPEPNTPVKDIIAGQAAFGLGKITVIGFDLDRAPFTEFPSRPEFWDWVLYEGGANRASGEGKTRPAAGSLSEEEDEATVALRTHIDTFEGVPVVSFGWVAVLIVLYILLIGPVEYYFLKRVLGRLELTWITFPVIVLTVSIVAYFSAYSLKGRDLKINKIDVVDIDPATGRVYGTTWFTVFSPRIDAYTVGVTPGDGWGQSDPGTVVSWVGAPRGGRASLLQRKYSYHTDSESIADGLEGVPVQVWGTKSFGANWSGGFNATAPNTLARSELVHPPGDPSTVIGSFTLNLPAPVLSDCVLFYAGQAYPLPGGTIRPGETIRPVWDKLVPASQWLQKEGGLNDLLRLAPAFNEGAGRGRTAAPQAANAPAVAFGSVRPWGVLFHESSLTYSANEIPRNASLRRLDQSWRLHPEFRSEVILVGRMVTPSGTPAEEALSGPGAASRLWLRQLPGTGERTPIPGTGRQETWVRVYLPIK